MSVLSTSSETRGEKWEQQLSRLECSSERRAPMFPRSYKHLKIAWCIHKQRDWTQVSRVWQCLCVTLCAAGWWREVSRAARLGLCDQVFGDEWVMSHDSWPESFRWLTFLPLLFFPAAGGLLTRWMDEWKDTGTQWKEPTISFPICHVSAASASVSFPNLFWSVYQLPPHETYLPYQHVSISINRGYVGFKIRQVVFRPPPPPPRLHIWRHPPDLSLNLKGRVMSQHEKCEMLEWEVWLISVSASSWSLHAERPSLATEGRTGFIKTSQDWVTSLVWLINQLRPTVEMW